MRPPRHQVLMDTAYLWAKRGTCDRAHVGALIHREGRILVQGYNGAPAGIDHCVHIENIPCEIAVHAEANAIAYSAKVGVALQGSEMVTTKIPCLNCAMLVINAGITSIVYSENHRDMRGLELLAKAGLQVVRYDMIDR